MRWSALRLTLRSVLEVDDQNRLHPLAAPSLPASYSAALDGVPIGPNIGFAARPPSNYRAGA